MSDGRTINQSIYNITSDINHNILSVSDKPYTVHMAFTHPWSRWAFLASFTLQSKKINLCYCSPKTYSKYNNHTRPSRVAMCKHSLIVNCSPLCLDHLCHPVKRHAIMNLKFTFSYKPSADFGRLDNMSS